MATLKQHKITDTALSNVPLENSENADFSKYKNNDTTTTWLYIKDYTVTYLSQFNVNNKIYGSFFPEPYELFLSHAKELSINTTQIQNAFDCHTSPLEVSENFKINIVEQNTFDTFILSKINCVVFLIMSVESFVNNIIPNNFTFKDKTKIEIERRCNLENKIKKVVPKIKQISDITLYQNKCSEILTLNALRNNFIHLKTTSLENEFVPILKDIEKLLKLDMEAEYSKIADYIQTVNQYQNIS